MMWQSDITAHYEGASIPAVGPSLKCQWGKKSVLPVAGAELGWVILAGSFSELPLEYLIR